MIFEKGEVNILKILLGIGLFLPLIMVTISYWIFYQRIHQSITEVQLQGRKVQSYYYLLKLQLVKERVVNSQPFFSNLSYIPHIRQDHRTFQQQKS